MPHNYIILLYHTIENIAIVVLTKLSNPNFIFRGFVRNGEKYEPLKRLFWYNAAYRKFTAFSLDLSAGLMYNVLCMIMRTPIGGVFVAEKGERIAELSEKYKARALEQSISRVKAEMSAEIAGFAQKYVFADRDTSERLKRLVDELPGGHGGFDFDKLPAHRAFSAKGVDTREINAYFCSLVGSEEIFEVFVKGRLSDFLDDYDDWYFYGAYMLLVYEDFGGFVYIDDNQNMTEAFLR